MNILITGATSGIGTALATGLAQDGHLLHLHGRDESRLKRLAGTLSKSDRQPRTYVADLSRGDEITALAQQMATHVSSLDLLINNAFGKLESPLSESDPEDIAAFFSVSVTGTVLLTRSVLDLLAKASAPRIINIVADWGFPMHNIMTGPSPYIAGKYAVHGLGVALQTELGSQGIRTTNICPGIVAADAPYDMSPSAFSEKYGVTAIHPRTIVDAVRFITGSPHAHVRSIVLSPPNPSYNGL